MKRLVALILLMPAAGWAQVGGGIADPGVYAPFAATGTSLPRTAQDRDAEITHLRDFTTASGTLACTGADDYQAFSSALTSLSARGGGILMLPAAACLVSAPIVLPGAGVGYALIKILGQGPATVVSPLGPMTSVFSVPSGHVDLQDLSIINVGGYAASGITETKAQNNLPTRFMNLRITGFNKGIQIATGDNYDISNNFFLNNVVAISLEDKCMNGRIRSNYILGGNGINFPIAPTQQCEGVAIDHNDILPGSNGSYALQILSGLQIDLTDNIFDQVTNGPGVNIDATNHSIADITFKGGWIGAQGGATAQTTGLVVNGSVQNLTVSAVTFVGWLGYDISATNTNGLNLVDDRLTSTSGTGNLYLNNAAANVVRGTTFKHVSNSVTEVGSTATYATMNVFAATPTRLAASRYVFNNGDALGDIDSGHTTSGNSKAMISGGTGTVVYQATGTVNDIFAVLQSKGLGGVLLAPNGTTKLSVNTNYTAFANAMADQSAQVISSGGSANVTAGAGRVILKGVNSTFQLTMTASPIDGQQLLLECDTAVTSLSINPASGQSIVGTGAACSSTQGHLWHYRSADASWHMAF